MLLNLPGTIKAFTRDKMKFSIKDFFSKCGQIRRKLLIWSHLQKKSLMENFIFCVVNLREMSITSRQICAYLRMSDRTKLIVLVSVSSFLKYHPTCEK